MEFYASVFDSEIMSITSYREFGAGDEFTEAEKDGIMNAQLLILGGHLLMASDSVAAHGGPVQQGNNTHIVLMTDSRPETDALFAKLADGGDPRQPPADMGFGYYAELSDKFGTNWMFFNTPE